MRNNNNDSKHSPSILAGAVVLGGIFTIAAVLTLPLAAPAIAVGAGAVGISALSSTAISVGFIGLSAVIGGVSGGIVGNKIASNAIEQEEQQQQQSEKEQEQKRPEESRQYEQQSHPSTPKFVLKLRESNIKEYGFLGVNQWHSDQLGALIAFNAEYEGKRGVANNEGEADAKNFIIIDPAGDAFLGIGGDLSGGGASGELYKIYKKRPSGSAEEGIKLNNKNEIIGIETGYAVYNDIWNNNNSPYYGIIHAVGPNKQGVTQEKLLTKCLKNVFIKYHAKASTKEEKDRPGLRIPAISSSIYRDVKGYEERGGIVTEIKQSDDDYNAMLIRAIESGYNMACKESGEEIKFGHGLEICMYEQKMYNSMIKNIRNKPSPAPSPTDSSRINSSHVR